MADLYVRTIQAVIGPVSGVEIREAALAGVIRHDAVIGGSPEGPWHLANEIGLFSEKRTPLPHPSGTDIPMFQIRNREDEPLKLRELIGFISRGLMPLESEIRIACMVPAGSNKLPVHSGNTASEGVQPVWFKIPRMRILAACLSGELVRVSEAGQLIPMSSHELIVKQLASEAVQSGQQLADSIGRRPIDVAEKAAIGVISPQAKQHRVDQEEAAAAEAEQENLAAKRNAELEQQHADQAKRLASAKRWHAILHPGEKIGRLIAPLKKRYASQLPVLRVAGLYLAIAVVFIGTASAYVLLRDTSLGRDEVIGRWVALGNFEEGNASSFEIHLSEDGNLSIESADGAVWQGGFRFSSANVSSGLPAAGEIPTISVIETIDADQEHGFVVPDDGHIELSGFIKDPPLIDGRAVRDFFVRRKEQNLLVGYPAAIHMTTTSSFLEVGWIEMALKQ